MISSAGTCSGISCSRSVIERRFILLFLLCRVSLPSIRYGYVFLLRNPWRCRWRCRLSGVLGSSSCVRRMCAWRICLLVLDPGAVRRIRDVHLLVWFCRPWLYVVWRNRWMISVLVSTNNHWVPWLFWIPVVAGLFCSLFPCVIFLPLFSAISSETFAHYYNSIILFDIVQELSG